MKTNSTQKLLKTFFIISFVIIFHPNLSYSQTTPSATLTIAIDNTVTRTSIPNESFLNWVVKVNGWTSLKRNAQNEMSYKYFRFDPGTYTIHLESFSKKISNTVSYTMPGTVYSCTGNYPSTPEYGDVCNADSLNLKKDTPITFVDFGYANCTTARRCEAHCAVGYTPNLSKTACVTPSEANSYQYSKVENRQLMTDFDLDGIYDPFFVKGVNYAPTPIGHFIGRGPGWANDCWYSGVVPLANPTLRFETTSPDSAYTCGASMENFYQDLSAFDRDFSLLQAMNTNTIRTWGNVTPELMQKANEYGLKVIAGYWIDHGIDYTFSGATGTADKKALIDDFVNYVTAFKDDPALLMWGLSNENNLNFCNECVFGTTCDRAAQATGFYQLVNEMTLKAKQAEGSYFHPVTVVSAELTDDLKNYGSNMTDVDIIGINSYRGNSFDGSPVGNPNLFDDFDLAFPNKPMLITEFGTDAWDSGTDPARPENGFEDQTNQSNYVLSAFEEIISYSYLAGGPALGGVVFNYSDEHNDYSQRPANADPNDNCVWISSDWTPSVITQDYEYTDPLVFGLGVAPDNKVNPEWWGIMSVAENLDGLTCSTPTSVDCMTPRTLYYQLRDRFLTAEDPLLIQSPSVIASVNTTPQISPIENQVVTVGSTLEVTITALDADGDSLSLGTTNSVAGLSIINNPTEILLDGTSTTTASYQWTPVKSQLGDYQIAFYVTDSNGNITNSPPVTITVKKKDKHHKKHKKNKKHKKTRKHKKHKDHKKVIKKKLRKH